MMVVSAFLSKSSVQCRMSTLRPLVQVRSSPCVLATLPPPPPLPPLTMMP